MRLQIVAVLILVLCKLELDAAQNSWAKQLRRAAKRTLDAKKTMNSTRFKGITRSSLVAAESGGYSLKQQTYRYGAEPSRKYGRYEYLTPTKRVVHSYAGAGCYGRPPGMYGNPGYNCRVFHICQADGRFDKMDCPASLRFNNYLGVCDWPNQVDRYCNPMKRYQKKFGPGPYVEYVRGYPEKRYYSPEVEMQYAAAEPRETITNVEKEKPVDGKREKEVTAREGYVE